MNLDTAEILVSLLRFRGGKGFTQAQEVVRARIACPEAQPGNERRMKNRMREVGIGLAVKILLPDSRVQGPTWGGEGERGGKSVQ